MQLQSQKWLKNIRVPIHQNPRAVKGRFQFVPPREIVTAGSYVTGTCIKPSVTVDLVLVMPLVGITWWCIVKQKVRVTVESSFLVDIQCLWISLDTLTDKFAFPWTCSQKFKLSLKMCNEPNYQHTKVFPNELYTFGYWPPQIKMTWQ